jgi:hypothetical protein
VIVDTDTNRAAYVRLIELVRSGTAIAFAGAGVAAPLNYPTWPGVMEHLAEAIRRHGIDELQINGMTLTLERVLRDFKTEPLIQAHIFQTTLGDEYYQILSDLFAPKEERSPSISNLVELPFKHLLTSNYDSSLEQHHNPNRPPRSICLREDCAGEFVQTFPDSNCPRYVVHVHGRHDDPRRIVLAEFDYGVYERDATVRSFWNAAKVTARFVFFGCSLTDVDLLHGFKTIRRTLQTNGLRHFAIIGLNKSTEEETTRIRLQMQYGIDPVFYSKVGQDFRGYDDLLSRLREDAVTVTPEHELEAPTPGELVPDTGGALELRQSEQAVSEVALREGMEHLKQLSRATIARRQTGDLE